MEVKKLFQHFYWILITVGIAVLLIFIISTKSDVLKLLPVVRPGFA